MRRFYLIWLLTLGACAKPMIWDKPGGTQQEFSADQYSCEKDARQSGYFGGGLIRAVNMKNFFKECMVAHGYELRQ